MFVSCEQARRQDYESHCETPTGEAAGRRRHSAPTALRPVREYRWNFESVTSLIDLVPNMTHPSTFVSCCLSSATLTAATDTYCTSTKTALLIFDEASGFPSARDGDTRKAEAIGQGQGFRHQTNWRQKERKVGGQLLLTRHLGPRDVQ